MTLTTLVGLFAATFTTISFVPQAIKTIRSKDVKGLSLGMYSVFAAGIICWLIYGIASKDLPIILANAFTLVFVLIILVYIVKYK